MVRDAEDVRRAAVVLLQPHDLDLREILLELQDVAQVRAAPAVDRLVGIARDGQVRIVDRQGPDDGVLGQVRVLVLVDQDVAVAGVQLSPQLVLLAQQRGHVQQQVVEIDRIGREQPLLVGRIDPGHDGSEGCGAGHVLLGRDQVVLGPTDRAGDGFRRRVREFRSRFGPALPSAPAGCRPCRRSCSSRAGPPAARIAAAAGRRTVERAHPDASALRQPLDALPHLVGRLVGERQGQDLLGATPCSSRFAMRCVTTRVLPLPGPARISSGPSTCAPPRAEPASARPADRRCRGCGAKRPCEFTGGGIGKCFFSKNEPFGLVLCPS